MFMNLPHRDVANILGGIFYSTLKGKNQRLYSMTIFTMIYPVCIHLKALYDLVDRQKSVCKFSTDCFLQLKMERDNLSNNIYPGKVKWLSSSSMHEIN